MTSIEQTIDFSVPPDDVWAVLADVSRIGDWVDEHRGFPDGPPAELREGLTYTQTLDAAGQSVDMEWTVVELDAPRALAFDGDGPAGSKATLRYHLEAADGGTHMRYATSFDLPGGPLGALAGKVAAPSDDDAQATLERLRALVEGG